MNGLFGFQTTMIDSGGQRRVLHLIYSGVHIPEVPTVEDYLSKRFKHGPAPDHVLVLCPQPLVGAMKQRFKGIQAIDRLRRSSIQLASFDQNAQLNSLLNLAPRSNGLETLDRKVVSVALFPPQGDSSLLLDGLTSFIVPRGRSQAIVLEKAPEGYLFTKPSSRNSNYFIRAENALIDQDFVAYLALAVFQFSLARAHANEALRVIYVDTMSIAILGHEIASLLEVFAHLSSKRPRAIRLESFGSYEGLKSPEFNHVSNSFCLISASTSLSLADAWIKRFPGHPASQTLTLFSYLAHSDKNPLSRTLFTLTKPNDDSPDTSMQSSQGYREIRIIGERFVVEPSLPKEVEFGAMHGKNLSKTLTPLVTLRKALVGQNVLKVNVADKAIRRDLFIEAEKLLLTPIVHDWIKKTASQRVSTGVRYIVAQSDPASKQMGQTFVKDLRSVNSSVELLVEDQLTGIEKFNGNVIVVAAVVGRGSRLLNISRDLRIKQASGDRQYLVACICADSAKSIDSLRSDLCMSGPQDKFTMESCLALAIGENRGGEAWTAEGKLLSLDGLQTIFQKRRDILDSSTTTGLTTNTFAETPSNRVLMLRPSFVFWGGDSNDFSAEDTPLVYATIRSVIQNARENVKDLPEPRRLGSVGFQQVVVSPAFFDRFNDGIIQASLLRSARDHELDFRGRGPLSERMKDFISQAAQSPLLERGEAALELLIALNTKRLKLNKEDIAGLIKELKDCKAVSQCKPLEALINHLDATQNTNGSRPFPTIDSDGQQPF
jgi:hypothetical protein